MCARPAGVACGRSPIPAPFWLHHAPRCGRRSTLESLTNVFRSVDVEAAVGRVPPGGAVLVPVAADAGQLLMLVQPQPLRDVSMSIPSVVGKWPLATPPLVSCVH